MKHALDPPARRLTEFACTCGVRGPREAVMQHLAERALHEGRSSADDLEPSLRSRGFPQAGASAVPTRMIGDDTTEAHYLPSPPKAPATKEAVTAIATAPTSPEPDDAATPSVAAAFQSMLRAAYQAGRRSTATGDTFETWYQREVLR